MCLFRFPIAGGFLCFVAEELIKGAPPEPPTSSGTDCDALGIDANSICKEENATLFQDKVRMSCMTSKKKCQACAVEDLN